MELTNFTERALKRISPVYDNSTFIRHFFNGVGSSFDLIREYMKIFREQSFIETVSWGIELQEHKYSLDPRPDLTLEERRKRLGIKAQIHRPINPARLEKAILENFDTKTYLYEKDPGWIRIYMNHVTEENYSGLIDFLQTEKPAHLALSTHIHIPIYPGGEGEEPDNPVVPPDEDPPYPKTPEEKKLFPRIFFGIGQSFSGEIKIEPPKPTNEILRFRASTAQIVGGHVQISPQTVDNQKMILHAGIGSNIGGEIIIDSEYYLPPRRIRENPTAMLAVPGSDTLLWKKRPQLLRRNILMAEEDFKPFGAIARGALTFIPPDDDLDAMGYDTVKIFFDFPISRHRRYRGVAMQNARDDLTKAEIKAVGQYAVDNKLIMNAAGEIATSVSHAALKLKTSTTMF